MKRFSMIVGVLAACVAVPCAIGWANAQGGGGGIATSLETPEAAAVTIDAEPAGEAYELPETVVVGQRPRYAAKASEGGWACGEWRALEQGSGMVRDCK